jgi:poly(A) polymerase
MAAAGILKVILPHTDEWRVMGRLPPDAILRLFVLALDSEGLKEILRLSNSDALRLGALRRAPELSPALSGVERRRIMYHLGAVAWHDAVWLSFARSRAKINDANWLALLDMSQQWSPPTMPIKGADLIEAGFASGPQLGSTLAALEDWWVASDFSPTRDDLLVRMSRYKSKGKVL